MYNVCMQCPVTTYYTSHDNFPCGLSLVQCTYMYNVYIHVKCGCIHIHTCIQCTCIVYMEKADLRGEVI